MKKSKSRFHTIPLEFRIRAEAIINNGSGFDSKKKGEIDRHLATIREEIKSIVACTKNPALSLQESAMLYKMRDSLLQNVNFFDDFLKYLIYSDILKFDQDFQKYMASVKPF